MEANKDKIEIESDWCYYLVAFLDVLGQKEVFNQISKIRSYSEIDDELKEEICGNLLYL
jgi:hypothetical protein